MEVSLEKIMLILVGLCFASMICVPLIEDGVMQVQEQYAYFQFRDMVRLIDNGIYVVINNTESAPFQVDVYVPNAVTINSSGNNVTFLFQSDSIAATIREHYPLDVDISFSHTQGWYVVSIRLVNSTLITASFTQIDER